MSDAAGRARRQELLEAIRAQPGDWTTGMALRWYRANGWPVTRTVARADLGRLVADGLLLALGPENARFYRLNPARDPRLGHGWQTPANTPGRVKHRPRRR
ncbi:MULTISPECIES: hypothetical protein [Streptomyces]|uniref:hypothetical protein n=1 Tax=Streptomyces TaxID=1883 RepID=UPI00073E05B2|nr:hypothetical protein [Streptomyces sp. FBKL.4005]MYU28618.1 hypothetical protein [Streptomyces sp. SID7810]OYP17018.1 hypothetical protein CFC35_22995 [Streptomyces sp. FBKL.4005]CUW29657.1 hypothetical protein TUE45_04366 [Streptomyces reticuli]